MTEESNQDDPFAAATGGKKDCGCGCGGGEGPLSAGGGGGGNMEALLALNSGGIPDLAALDIELQTLEAEPAGPFQDALLPDEDPLLAELDGAGGGGLNSLSDLDLSASLLDLEASEEGGEHGNDLELILCFMKRNPGLKVTLGY